MIIKLSTYQQKDCDIFSGRPNGQSVRNKLTLSELEKKYDLITVEIPEDTISVNTSFFLGLFGQSIRELGEIGFRQKYKFIANQIILNSMEDDLQYALKNSSVLEQ